MSPPPGLLPVPNKPVSRAAPPRATKRLLRGMGVEQRERPENFYNALASFGIDSKKRRGTRGLVCVFHPDGKPDNSIDEHRVVAQAAV